MNKATVLLILVVVVIGVIVGSVLLMYEPLRLVIAPPEPPPPPEPSVDEIYAEISPSIEVLKQVAEQGTAFGQVAKLQAIDAVGAAMEQHQDSANGRMALARLADEVRQICREARRGEHWKFMREATEVFGVFRRNEFFMSFYTDLAKTQLARPEVILKGFLDDLERNDTYAFLEIRILGKKKVETVKVREGEEFLDPPHTLKFHRIIGRNRGVELEFIAIPGDFFEVMLTELPEE